MDGIVGGGRRDRLPARIMILYPFISFMEDSPLGCAPSSWTA
ncbi:MAG: hypothetical protein ACLU5I_10575 [Alistipes finegoldii]